MPENDHSFVAWEEHILCHERGNRVVHYYLKKESGDLVLAVVGTERSIRHMMYVVSDEFVKAYGSKGFVNACTKWRARREVVEWLTSLVSKQPPADFSNSLTNDSTLASSMTGSTARRTFLPDQMVSRKLKVEHSEIEWSGIAWICTKQLKHYPAFCRNGTTISVHSFVFIMALDDHHYLGYLEDMYEDRKGQKKVKVRWFHHNQEVKDLIPQLNPHPREVFITPHVQVISAECVDGPATVLTPKHYEKCMAIVAENSSSGVRMCFRQLKNHKLRPFALAKLRGYSNQAILASIDANVVAKQKVKCSKLCGEDEAEFVHDDHVRVGSKRNRNSKGEQGLKNGSSGPGNHVTKCEPTYPKLKLRLRKPMDINIVGTESQLPVYFSVDERIELLCQDSGIRGCWFQCKIMQISQKLLKVQYDDVEDADGFGNLEEWIPAFREAAPDKLGMRCSGRLTIRPCPPKDSMDITIEVGTPVDAWWNDGWWEGVVTGVEGSGTGTVQVYVPGEERFLTIPKNKIRASKDWDGSSWVDIKARPDILLYLRPSTKVSTGTAELSGSEVYGIRKHKVDEDGKGLHDLAASVEVLKLATDSNSVDCPFSNDKIETNNFDSNNNADAGNEDKSCLEEGLCPEYEKSEAAEAT